MDKLIEKVRTIKQKRILGCKSSVNYIQYNSRLYNYKARQSSKYETQKLELDEKIVRAQTAKKLNEIEQIKRNTVNSNRWEIRKIKVI